MLFHTLTIFCIFYFFRKILKNSEIKKCKKNVFFDFIGANQNNFYLYMVKGHVRFYNEIQKMNFTGKPIKSVYYHDNTPKDSNRGVQYPLYCQCTFVHFFILLLFFSFFIFSEKYRKTVKSKNAKKKRFLISSEPIKIFFNHIWSKDMSGFTMKFIF